MAKRSRLSRTVGTRRVRKTISVWCEGAVTEAEYLEALRSLPDIRRDASVEIVIESKGEGAVPITLVRAAATQKKRARVEDDETDEYWCVFDVEWPQHHPDLKPAIDLARANGIRVAISNPCFELWLILHHQEQNAFLDTAAAVRLRRDCDRQPGKGVSGVEYMTLRHAAEERAKRLDQIHIQNGTKFPHDNPSTGMHLLLATLRR